MQNTSVAWFQYIDKANDLLCRLVSWLTLFMVLITFAIVVLRYGFDMGWIAMQESVMYLHALVFLLGSAHTLRVDEHVRVDIFYRKYSPRRQALVDGLGTLFLLMPVNLFLLVISFEFVSNSWSMMEDSQEAGGLPFVYLLKTFILFFAFTMTLQGVAQIARNIGLYKRADVDIQQGGK